MISREINVVEASIAAVNRVNPAEIGGLITVDHTFVDAAGRTEAGRDKMAAGWEKYFKMFSDYWVCIDNILEDGELVAVFGSAAGTCNGKRGMVPDNQIVMPAARKALITDGEIRYGHGFADWTVGYRSINEDKPAAGWIYRQIH